MNESTLIQTTLEDATSTINNLPYKDSVWTQEIMTRLCDTGQKNGYYVCVSRVDAANHGEWLYDMTWLRRDGDRLTNVGLVLELEWGYFPEVHEDFEKLLLAKANLRCMIFWAANRQDAVGYIQTLLNQVLKFQKTARGDNYLFCVWLEDEARFDFNSYTDYSEEK